tara:strand:+ start:482 stop:910 length:429 start_codon:yes stop_codon:yes gene_type:complete
MKNKKYKVGYTTGVFDLFHIGHLNILKKSKNLCHELIVGISTDDLVFTNKRKYPVINLKERLEIVKSIKFVDKVVIQKNSNKFTAHRYYKFDVLFVGDDWKGDPKWIEYEQMLNKKNVDVIYFPYTKSTSSTKINQILDKFR